MRAIHMKETSSKKCKTMAMAWQPSRSSVRSMPRTNNASARPSARDSCITMNRCGVRSDLTQAKVMKTMNRHGSEMLRPMMVMNRSASSCTLEILVPVDVSTAKLVKCVHACSARKERKEKKRKERKEKKRKERKEKKEGG